MPFTFQASTSHDQARLVAVLAAGLSEALLAGAVPLEHAMIALFNPFTLARLEEAGADPRAMELIHLGTELEDVRDLVPEALERSLQDIRQRAMDLLRELTTPPTGRWCSAVPSRAGPLLDPAPPEPE